MSLHEPPIWPPVASFPWEVFHPWKKQYICAAWCGRTGCWEQRERGGGLLGPKGNMRARGLGEAGEGEVVKAKALFRFFKAEFSLLSLASSVESDEGGAGEGAGTGWEDAPPRKGLVVDLTAVEG